MQLTYLLDQLIALQSGAGYFDLHSDYELVSALREGTWGYLHFVKRTAPWIKAPDPLHLSLVFEQVHYFHLSQGLRLPTSVEEMGWKEPSDADPDSFMQQPSGESSHLLFRLEAEHFIRIGAQTSSLLASSSNKESWLS
jgi:hypothetical protein